MRKNSHGRILKGEPKEQNLSTVLKFCSIKYIRVLNHLLIH